MIILDSASTTLRFEGLPSRPVASLFRQFSAPVKLTSAADQEDRLFLARHDSDPYNRWQALQDIAVGLLIDDANGKSWAPGQAAALAAALADTAASDTLDDAFKAHALTLPSLNDIARLKGSEVDPDRLLAGRERLIRDLVGEIGEVLATLYRQSVVTGPYAPDAAQAGRRALRQAALALLVSGSPSGPGLAVEQYHEAGNMTERLGALAAAVSAWTPEAADLLADFRTRYTADPLVFDKWLGLSALPPRDATLERVRAILAEPDFPRNNPNRLRALAGSFALNNLVQFARADGEGFRFVTSFVADVDTRNPQVAARVLTAFRIWPQLEAGRRSEAQKALAALRESTELSINSRDILDRVLMT